MNKIIKRLQEHYNHVQYLGYEIFGIYLQGSQNYKLDTPQSDIDSKCIVIPTLDDIVSNRAPVSTTIVLPNNEHIDVKDIRVYFDTFKKQNINFVEILFTEYSIVNPFYQIEEGELYCERHRIVRLDFNKAINCIVGMSQQKYVALKHPYPTILDKIEKYGYDPKQLHHIARMNLFIKRYAKGEPYEKCLVETKKNREWLIGLKQGILPLKEAEELAAKLNQDTYDFSKTVLRTDNIINTEVIETLDAIKRNVITKSIKKEIMGNV